MLLCVFCLSLLHLWSLVPSNLWCFVWKLLISPLEDLRTFPLSTVFWNFTMLCLVIGLFFLFMGVDSQWATLLWKFMFFCARKCFYIIYLIYSYLFSLSFFWSSYSEVRLLYLGWGRMSSLSYRSFLFSSNLLPFTFWEVLLASCPFYIEFSILLTYF